MLPSPPSLCHFDHTPALCAPFHMTGGAHEPKSGPRSASGRSLYILTPRLASRHGLGITSVRSSNHAYVFARPTPSTSGFCDTPHDPARGGRTARRELSIHGASSARQYVLGEIRYLYFAAYPPICSSSQALARITLLESWAAFDAPRSGRRPRFCRCSRSCLRRRWTSRSRRRPPSRSRRRCSATCGRSVGCPWLSTSA